MDQNQLRRIPRKGLKAKTNGLLARGPAVDESHAHKVRRDFGEDVGVVGMDGNHHPLDVGVGTERPNGTAQQSLAL